MAKKKYEEPDDDELIMSTRELRGDLSEALMRTAFGGEHIIVTHHGRRFAALVSMDDLEIIKTSKDKAHATSK